MSKPDFVYTIMSDGRVKIVNLRGQVTILRRYQVENALAILPMSPEMKQKYEGALVALNAAEKERQI